MRVGRFWPSWSC